MFETNCDNKGCGKYQPPVLDISTNQVLCTECGQEIQSISPFAKTTLKSMGQVKRDPTPSEAFSVKCTGCLKTSKPNLVKNTLICPYCGKQHQNLSPFFINAIKASLSKK